MKTLIMNLVLLTSALSAMLGVAAETTPAPVMKTVTMDFTSPNRESVYVLAKGYTSKRAEFGEMLYDLVQTAPANDVIHFFEADEYQHKHVFSVTVPDVEDEFLRDVDYPMQRAQTESAKILEYKQPEKPKRLSRSELIDLQQISLQRLGATVRSVRQTTFPLCVVLAGTPIFNGEKVHRGFSMEFGDVPGLATLKDSQSHISPFFDGVVDLPSNSLVTILSDTGWGIDHIHETRCEAYWRTFLRERGGAHLMRITDSVASAFRLRKPQITEPQDPEKSHAELNVEFGVFPATMYSVLDLEGKVPTIIYFGLSDKKRAIHEPNPLKKNSVEAAIDRAMRSQTETLYAFSWQMDRTDWTFTDPDLYAFSSTTPDVLCYKQLTTPFGELLKDVRYGEETIRGGNVELMFLKNDELPNLSLYANVHIAVGPIECLLRTFGNGIKKEYQFTIPSVYGDEGDNEFRKDDHPSWLKLPLTITDQQLSSELPRQANHVSSTAAGSQLGSQLGFAVSSFAKNFAADFVTSSQAIGNACASLADGLAGLSTLAMTPSESLAAEANQGTTVKQPSEVPAPSTPSSTPAVVAASKQSLPAAGERVPLAEPTALPPVSPAERSILVATKAVSPAPARLPAATTTSAPVEYILHWQTSPYYHTSFDCPCY